MTCRLNKQLQTVQQSPLCAAAPGAAAGAQAADNLATFTMRSADSRPSFGSITAHRVACPLVEQPMVEEGLQSVAVSTPHAAFSETAFTRAGASLQWNGTVRASAVVADTDASAEMLCDFEALATPAAGGANVSLFKVATMIPSCDID